MNEIVNYVTFDSNFPDDSEEDLNGDVVIPSGRAVLNQVRSGMSRECSEVQQRSHYGWEFDFEREGGSVSAILQYDGKWLLIVEPRPSKLLFFWRNLEFSKNVVKEVDLSLRQIDEIFNVRWMTAKEYSQGII